MPGQVVLKGYQIGYRICSIEHTESWCDCAYTDLPVLLLEDCDCSGYATLSAAQKLLDQMRKDFWAAEAEWRIVECWE